MRQRQYARENFANGRAPRVCSSLVKRKLEILAARLYYDLCRKVKSAYQASVPKTNILPS